MHPIYLDYNATTPVDETVLEAMLPFFSDHFGNAASEHVYGWIADEAVEQARERLAGFVGVRPGEVVFTSGATEAINLAIRGAAAVYGGRRHHLVTVATEHKAVLETAEALEDEGFEVTVLPVDGKGRLDLDELREAATDATFLVAAMWANNETGVIHPVAEIAEIAHEAGALFLTDATQAVGKVPVDAKAAGVDLLALSAHKLYGPKGVGALTVRRRPRRVRLAPMITGGSQQDGLRGGTLNVPGIVGLGAAAELAQRRMAEDTERITALRDRFEQEIANRVEGAVVNAVGAPRLPNTTSIRFEGVRTHRLLPAMRGVAASTGAACQTRTAAPSHVLTAMGLSPEASFSTVRFSLGHSTSEKDITTAVDEVARAVETVRRRVAA